MFDPSLAESTITLAEGQLEITDDLSITGPVADDAGGIVIDGDAQSRLLFIEGATASEFAVDVTGMTLTNGFESGTPGGAVHVYFADLNLNHVTVSNNTTEATPSQTGGAGVYARYGDVELHGVTVAGNAASTSGIVAAGGGLSVFDGDLTITDSTITGNSIDPGLVGTGAGFRVYDGNLAMSGTTISENTISSRGYGGGFSVFGDSASAVISNSIVSNNSASYAPNQSNGGGGLNISILGGTVELTDVIISGNSGGSGGGAKFDAESGLLTRVTVTDNTASKGEDQEDSVMAGGIFFGEGDFNLVDCTISGNVATEGSGGGLYFELISGSGQVGSLTLLNTTVSGNSADGPSGGINSREASLELVNSTVSGNSSGESGAGIRVSGASANLTHTTVAFNAAGAGADGIDFGSSDSSDQLSLNNSMIFQAEAGETACNAQADNHSNTLATDNSCTGTSTNLADIDLQPLADNGGPTLTHALGADSVAIDAAGDCGADFSIDLDQRGIPRPGPGSSACDIGAFEFFSDGIFADRFEDE
ncbi:choice-of-anchor Q domain-containing protein [Wenzhouxiangella sp. EGI_FJ10409]|uniref:choice-of-anchor Q domain-containing protein n=1 Tax=Wenzhouxiangella sp. EGI_FJ10409 TaxID=3243767 RepID=UPI0035DCB397